MYIYELHHVDQQRGLGWRSFPRAATVGYLHIQNTFLPVAQKQLSVRARLAERAAFDTVTKHGDAKFGFGTLSVGGVDSCFSDTVCG